MALFKFTKNIIEGKEIDVYNFGEMYRDFTFVEDLVRAIFLLIEKKPTSNPISHRDTLSKVAPFRIVNIGNSTKVKLTDFIEALEGELDLEAKKKLLPMQPGDVPATWADASLLTDLINYSPSTDYRTGVKKFVEWYKDHYKLGGRQ